MNSRKTKEKKRKKIENFREEKLINDKKDKRTEATNHLIKIVKIMVEVIIQKVVEWIIGIVIGKQDKITYLKDPSIAWTFFSYSRDYQTRKIHRKGKCVKIKLKLTN